MRQMMIAIALVTAAVPAMAQDAKPRAGQTLRGADNVRLGNIDSVLDDGSVRIIFKSRFVTVPADTLSVVDGKPVTKLSKKEVSALK